MILSGQHYDSIKPTDIPLTFWEGCPSPQDKRVFIKPNLVTPPTKWDKASTTRIEVTELVIQYLIGQGCKEIIVGDCGFKDQWESTIQLSGYDQLPLRYPQVTLIGLQEGPRFHEFTLQRLDGYMSLYGAKISDVVLSCDFVINIPKLKVHKMALVTGAIKNCMGMMAQKGSMHPRSAIDILHKRLHDLYFLMRGRVGFCVLDGIEGSEYSEQYGVPKYAGILLSTKDMYEMDIEASFIMGIHPRNVGYLRYITKTLGILIDPNYQPNELVTPFEIPLGYRHYIQVR